MNNDFYLETTGVKRLVGGRAGIFYEDLIKLESQLNFLPDGARLKITVEAYNEKKEKERLRTEAQNKYYHLLLDIMCRYTGDTHLELHENLKIEFLGKPYVKGDKEYILVGSTRGLNSKNFGEYLERVFQWASTEHNLMLPSSSNYY